MSETPSPFSTPFYFYSYFHVLFFFYPLYELCFVPESFIFLLSVSTLDFYFRFFILFLIFLIFLIFFLIFYFILFIYFFSLFIRLNLHNLQLVLHHHFFPFFIIKHLRPRKKSVFIDTRKVVSCDCLTLAARR